MTAFEMTQSVEPLAVQKPKGVYAREIRAELLKLLRNRGYSFSVIGFPVVFYAMFASINRHATFAGHGYEQYLLAGYSCFGAMGASLFGIGNGLAQERGHGWLELKRASPMPAAAYLVAKLVTALCFSLAITLLLAGLAAAMHGGPIVSVLELLRLLLVVAVGTLPFASLGLLIGLLISPTAGPGVMNLIYLPLSFCGGLWMPIESFPGWLQTLAHGLPSFWLSRLALEAFGIGTPAHAVAYSVLAGYTVLCLLLSTRVWSRSEAQA